MLHKLMAIGSIALLLAACATTGTTHLSEGKVLADAWSALDTAENSLDALNAQGVLTPAEKTTIKTVLPKAKQTLEDAQAAYDANNDATAQQNVATAASLAAELLLIVKAHK